MIRLNVFFEVKDSAGSVERAIEVGRSLVEASLNDRGCVAYGMFQSVTNERVFNIIETWEDEHALNDHMMKAHFLDFVPQLEKLSVNGLKMERFERV